MHALALEAGEFGKPVLLLNGDSHIFVDDAPLSASAPAYQRSMYGLSDSVDNLRRITTNGSGTCPHEYMRLTVDASTSTVFSVKRRPVPEPARRGLPRRPLTGGPGRRADA